MRTAPRGPLRSLSLTTVVLIYDNVVTACACSGLDVMTPNTTPPTWACAIVYKHAYNLCVLRQDTYKTFSALHNGHETDPAAAAGHITDEHCSARERFALKRINT